jgi:hypothetical protein
MTDLAIRQCVEVQVVGEATDLAATRPAPRRSAELVAARAATLGLAPHRRARAYRVWPFLITGGAAVSYLYVGLVIR